MRHASVLAALLAAVLTAVAAARGGQNVVISGSFPTLENKELPKGTGLVMGRVMEAETQRPVAGAIVFLGHASGASATPVMTDDRGRFVFSDLPKGSYSLRAFRAGYVGGAYTKRLAEEEPGRDGSPLVLAEDERLGDVMLRMWKHAAIGGTVLDETGEPVVGITVRAVPRRIVAGRAQFHLDYSSVTSQTDDRGMFRVSGLIPGDYLVAVPNVTGAYPKRRPLPVSTSAGPSSLAESSTGGLSWVTGSGSVRSGGVDVGDPDYLLASSSASLRLPGFAGLSPDGKVLGYETQFYPGVTTIARATIITLRSGDDRSGIDFQLRAVPTVRVSGTVVGVGGPPGDLMLRLVSRETASMLSRDPEIAQTISSPDGQFAFLGVPPGDYSVRVIRTPRPPPSADNSSVTVLGPSGSSSVVMSRPSRPPLPDRTTLWGEAAVSVGAQDVSGVTVALRSGARIKGRVEFEGTATPALDRLTGVHIERADGFEQSNLIGLRGLVDDQGDFSTYGQTPGKYFVRVPYDLPNWTFKGAMLGDRDLSVVPIDLSEQDVTGVVLKFTDRPPGGISGVVRNDRGQPADTATVVVFPVDRQLWTNTGANPRNLRSVGTGIEGRYTVTHLPPGEYFVAASDTAVAAWAEPGNLDRLARQATRVPLSEGETRTQDLMLPRRNPAPETHSAGDGVGHGPWVNEVDGAQAQAPTRDTPAAPVPGTGEISGIVLTADERPQPVRRALVTLSGAGLGTPSRSVVTDTTGRFVFDRLPVGRFSLSASKAAYLTANHGARQPGRAGISIDLTEAQKVEGIRLTLVRGAVIAGTIRDERGEPLDGANIQVLRYRVVNGERRLQSAGSLGPREQTDDRGAYRAFGLEPGEYIVAATMRSTSGQARIMTEADITSAIQALKRAPGRGSAPARPATVRYTPVFYPGTPDVAEATFVTVGVGEERTGIDFAFRLVPTAKVDGVVVNPAGPLPPTTEVRILNLGRPAGLSAGVEIMSLLPLRPRPDGTFSFDGLAPGQYALAATTTGQQPARGRGSAGGESLWATTDVTIAGTDISNITLTLQPGMSISGSVSFDATSLPVPNRAGMRISLAPILTGAEISVGQLTTTATAEGTFTFTGVMPGRYTVRALPPTGATGWLQRAVSVGGRETADEVVDVRAGESVTGVSIVFTDRSATLTGMLQNVGGQAAPDYFIILFPADKAQWRVSTRRIQQVRPGTDGRFTFRTLLPGSYLLAAVTDVETGEWLDPAFLEKLIPGAIPLTVAEGEKKVQDIRIAG